MSNAQEYYDSAMREGTKKKLGGLVLGSAGAFLAVGGAALTAGMTVAAAAPVLGMLGTAGLVGMVGGKFIHKEGEEHQVWVNKAYSKEIEEGTVQKKVGFLEKISNMRDKFLNNSVNNQNKFKI